MGVGKTLCVLFLIFYVILIKITHSVVIPHEIDLFLDNHSMSHRSIIMWMNDDDQDSRFGPPRGLPNLSESSLTGGL